MQKRGHLFLQRPSFRESSLPGNALFYFTCNSSARNIGTCPNYNPESLCPSRRPVTGRNGKPRPSPCHSEPVLWVRNLLSLPSARQRRTTHTLAPDGSQAAHPRPPPATLQPSLVILLTARNPRKHRRRRPKGPRRRLYPLYPEYQIGRLNRTRFRDLYSPANQ